MLPIRLLICYAALLVSVSAGPKSIDQYFLAVPRQVFTEGSPAELLRIIKSGDNTSIFDLKNGYMRLEGDGAQVSLQIALFRFKNKSPLLAVAWGELEQADFTHLTFFKEVNGKMILAERSTLPVPDSGKHRFELPRFGRTVIVRDAQSKLLSKWNWDGEQFVRE